MWVCGSVCRCVCVGWECRVCRGGSMDGRVVYESVGSVCGECVGVDGVCVGLRVWECVMWNMQ